MRTNQEGTIIRVSCEGEVTAAGLRRAEASAESAATGSGPAKAGPRHNTNHHAQPKTPARRKSAILAAVLVVATLVGWGVYHRLRSGTTKSAGAAPARGQTLPVPVVEGVVSTKDV